MEENPLLNLLMNRASVRSYRREPPSEEILQAVVRAGQQAPFASQLYSLILSRSGENRCQAPLLFTFCVDLHKLDLVMAHKGWQKLTNDLSLLLLGAIDACLAAENMVVAAETSGLASCFLSIAPKKIESIVQEYDLPDRVFPLVQLAMGYPKEEPSPRPRYPLEFTLFEERYPELTKAEVERAVQVMDEGYIAQDYYVKHGMWPLAGGRSETHTLSDYGWSEHISRKWGQRWPSLEEMLGALQRCGFQIGGTPAGQEI
jgi:FMN reductase (NADPH)